MYFGRALQTALDLGLNLPVSGREAGGGGVAEEEVEVRKMTFWGLFLIDKYGLLNLFGRSSKC
jgi:hypothetical protein